MLLLIVLLGLSAAAFSRTPTPRVHSPPTRQSTFNEHPGAPSQEPEIDRLCFVPVSLWDKEKAYDEQPPTYIHY
jgi:hypothetical protein